MHRYFLLNTRGGEIEIRHSTRVHQLLLLEPLYVLILDWLDILELVKIVIGIRVMVIRVLFKLFCILFAWNRHLLDLFLLASS